MDNLRKRLWRERPADSGFTLIELLVAMGLFTIFISVFLTAVVTLIRGTSQVTITAETSSKALIVFQNVDRQVRYADAINAPGDGLSGARYIEYRLPAESTVDGKTTCYQWRFVPSTGQIQTRYWFDLTGAVATPWATKLTSAQAPALPDANYPFKLIPASSDGSAKQQFVLTINAGNPGYDAKADVTSTFVARNSSQSSPSSVCLSTGTRP